MWKLEENWREGEEGEKKSKVAPAGPDVEGSTSLVAPECVGSASTQRKTSGHRGGFQQQLNRIQGSDGRALHLCACACVRACGGENVRQHLNQLPLFAAALVPRVGRCVLEKGRAARDEFKVIGGRKKRSKKIKRENSISGATTCRADEEAKRLDSN